MNRHENIAAGAVRARITGIAVELAYVLGLLALDCLACAIAFLVAG